MDIKCIICTKKFNDIHALKTHQPRCRGRSTAHIHGFNRLKRESKKKKRTGRKLGRGMDVSEEQLALERQDMREREEDDSGPARKQKNISQVGVSY